MSHSPESSTFKTYFRVLSYAKPYWRKILIGLIAGLVVGGSLFGSLMMIPSLMSGVNVSGKEADRNIEETVEKLTVIADTGGTDPAARKAALQKYFQKEKQREADKIDREIEKADKWLKRLGLISYSFRYQKGNVVFSHNGNAKLTFPAETQTGRMTWQFFSIFCIGLVLLWIIKSFATFINHYYMRWVGQRVVVDLRVHLFRRMLDQSLGYYGKTDIGQLISHCSNDTIAVEASVTNVVADITRCPLEILACAAAIIFASIQCGRPSLPLILFIGLPLCVLPVIIVGKKVRRTYKKALLKIADVTTRMHEVFSCIAIVKAYHTERREILRFTETNNGYFQKAMKAVRAQLFMPPFMEVVAVSATVVFLTYSYSQEVELTILVQLLAPCFLAYRPIKDLARITTYIQRSRAAAERIFNVIDTEAAIKESPNPVPFTEFNKQIRFEDVTFAYDTHKILDHVSFEIPHGSLVAVVGETGSGKSTIANLIARFYDCTEGRITIDDVDVRDLKITDLHNMIGVVTQDALLFNETIAYNIAYGMPEASEEQIINAAKLANAHKFITDGRHAEGYQTVVGEKGCILSGGEKQRISIARAILKNPPILILDEATSALDTVTEQLVQEALNNVMTNRTVFAIAHRLSTIRNANKIIVLDKGHIVESGTHDELVALNGRYKKLCDTQFNSMK